jgi:hypothetical protein
MQIVSKTHKIMYEMNTGIGGQVLYDQLQQEYLVGMILSYYSE